MFGLVTLFLCANELWLCYDPPGANPQTPTIINCKLTYDMTDGPGRRQGSQMWGVF